MITAEDLKNLTNKINASVARYSTSFHLTFHFSHERVNDSRNVPPIELGELEDIFERFIHKHIMSVIAMNDGEQFVIACRKTDIHIPCALKKLSDPNGGASHKNIIITITIMRKANFNSNDIKLII